MSPGPAIAVALIFVWLGMVLATSFLEAPLKFRAPNVTRQIGLGTGRLVFHALNSIEVLFASVIAALITVSPPTSSAATWSSRHQLSFWDAMIVRGAAELRCDASWTEDLNDGRLIEGIQLGNPFTRG
ncbi:hypothetical protein [Candidatus Mycobacterium methanotrophicum]|uniref:hypothetical protein n=1 Tax=Candidatus Mycobacterium methanotrophicum TaxID=2943498 RepID=UPI0027D94211|nr:hypothetical protein [Candidatus Mycobacterium methanotrophicum]